MISHEQIPSKEGPVSELRRPSCVSQTTENDAKPPTGKESLLGPRLCSKLFPDAREDMYTVPPSSIKPPTQTKMGLSLLSSLSFPDAPSVSALSTPSVNSAGSSLISVLCAARGPLDWSCGTSRVPRLGLWHCSYSAPISIQNPHLSTQDAAPLPSVQNRWTPESTVLGGLATSHAGSVGVLDLLCFCWVLVWIYGAMQDAWRWLQVAAWRGRELLAHVSHPQLVRPLRADGEHSGVGASMCAERRGAGEGSEG